MILVKVFCYAADCQTPLHSSLHRHQHRHQHQQYVILINDDLNHIHPPLLISVIFSSPHHVINLIQISGRRPCPGQVIALDKPLRPLAGPIKIQYFATN